MACDKYYRFYYSFFADFWSMIIMLQGYDKPAIIQINPFKDSLIKKYYVFY